MSALGSSTHRPPRGVLPDTKTGRGPATQGRLLVQAFFLAPLQDGRDLRVPRRQSLGGVSLTFDGVCNENQGTDSQLLAAVTTPTTHVPGPADGLARHPALGTGY